MSSKYVFITFVYPGVEKYLDSFIDSLNNQTDKDFDLMIHNDGLENIEDAFKKLNKEAIIYKSHKKKLINIRYKTIDYCRKNNYKYIIFGDSDDIFDKNRVSVLKEKLKKYELVVNDISIINNKNEITLKNVFSTRLSNNLSININNITNYNFIGFTNSAFSVNVIPQYLDYNNNIVAVDWHFFSQLLSNNINAIFTSDTISLYRQHDNNIGSLLVNHNNKNIDKIDYVKKVRNLHFESIKKLEICISDSHNKEKNLNKEKINFWWEL